MKVNGVKVGGSECGCGGVFWGICGDLGSDSGSDSGDLMDFHHQLLR